MENNRVVKTAKENVARENAMNGRPAWVGIKLAKKKKGHGVRTRWGQASGTRC